MIWLRNPTLGSHCNVCFELWVPILYSVYVSHSECKSNLRNTPFAISYKPIEYKVIILLVYEITSLQKHIDRTK